MATAVKRDQPRFRHFEAVILPERTGGAPGKVFDSGQETRRFGGAANGASGTK
jgi:hypothetical protein